MYSTSELDELFQILNSVKGFKLDNHIGATQQYNRYESSLDDTLIGIESLSSGYLTHRILDPKV